MDHVVADGGAGRVVRAALERVGRGSAGDLVVIDGTELSELQRGFNAMVNGLGRP